MRLPLATAPYLGLALRCGLGSATLDDVAFRREVLFPPVTEPMRPCVFLPDQLQRVTGTHPHLRLGELADAVRATSVTHSPTVAYHVRDAVVFDGSVYVGRYKHPVADRALFRDRSREFVEIPQASLASSYMGAKYFGHWLRDDCAQYELARTDPPVICMRGLAYPHLRDYAAHFKQIWDPVDRARVGHLVLYQDFAPNRSKRTRQDVLRRRLWAGTSGAGHELVYLKRGSAGALRKVANEPEIMEALVARGFTVVDTGADALSQIVAALRGARIVVSLEGSHVAHCVYGCNDDAGLLILQRPDRFTLNHRNWCAPRGMTFGFVVGHKTQEDYRFPPSDILATVDKMLAGGSNLRGSP